MKNFRIYNGNEGQYDNRIADAVNSFEVPVGTSYMFADVAGKLRIFMPRFNFNV